MGTGKGIETKNRIQYKTNLQNKNMNQFILLKLYNDDLALEALCQIAISDSESDESPIRVEDSEDEDDSSSDESQSDSEEDEE